MDSKFFKQFIMYTIFFISLILLYNVLSVSDNIKEVKVTVNQHNEALEFFGTEIKDQKNGLDKVSNEIANNKAILIQYRNKIKRLEKYNHNQRQNIDIKITSVERKITQLTQTYKKLESQLTDISSRLKNNTSKGKVTSYRWQKNETSQN